VHAPEIVAFGEGRSRAGLIRPRALRQKRVAGREAISWQQKDQRPEGEVNGNQNNPPHTWAKSKTTSRKGEKRTEVLKGNLKQDGNTCQFGGVRFHVVTGRLT